VADGRRVCPNEEFEKYNAHLRMEYGLETLDFDFRGPFGFIRHVSTTSPYPTALYRFSTNAYTRDKKYYAPGGNNVLLACNGRYLFDNRTFGRLWVGNVYGKLYNGPIVRNPEYEEPCDAGGGGGGYDHLLVSGIYDPYNPGSGSCGGGTGGRGAGSGTQYGPGESTGGETVDWVTGMGNGGSSACGEEAVVEYVCIDVWDGERWVEWACGWATTC
jgi:hypothetical protein